MSNIIESNISNRWTTMPNEMNQLDLTELNQIDTQWDYNITDVLFMRHIARIYFHRRILTRRD